MTQSFVPIDQGERNRIENSLDETLFVEAGAGTGKTTALVSRIVALIRTGRASIDGIAAITFTEAAAAELREKVRRALDKESQAHAQGSEERKRCEDAVRGLEGASIQTLHSFAGALLHERPLEAGLPPDFDVVEEIESDISFEDQWREWLDDVLESSAFAPNLVRALSLGLSIDSLRTIARYFHDNYDLLNAHFPEETEPERTAATQIVSASHEIRRLLSLAPDGEDRLAIHAEEVITFANRFEALGVETDAALVVLSRRGSLWTKNGRQSDWPTDPATGENACKLLKAILAELEEARSDELQRARRATLIPLLEGLRSFALEYRDRRRREGKAEFHDLLIWARDMLRDNLDARRYFQRRFSHILIDEFQDTDPIQAEIAFFLAGSPDEQDAAADWTQVRHLPGKLFVVGDPKQSIYRFRRADIAALDQIKGLLSHAATVPLVQNFRSQAPIISWVNSVFEQWMADSDSSLQASYTELAHRWIPPEIKPPLGVHWLGGMLQIKALEVQRIEAQSIADVLRQIKSVAWNIRDETTQKFREARYRDVCLLSPTRTNLRALEQAFDEADVPYRVESQSLVLDTQDVQELLVCLRAIDAPVDQVALVAALRSSAFACSDVELLAFVENGGKFDYNNPCVEDGHIASCMEILKNFHRERIWTSPDVLIEKFIRDRRMIEACFGRARPRERWRRLRFVVERARAFARVGGSSLRAFLDWIERQAEEGARMLEVPVPETDEDAVRVMTIHASKGLEFPIVILAGLGSGSNTRANTVIFNRATQAVEVRIGPSNGANFATSGYDDARKHDRAADESEAVRLMYVAATRAKDHLVVSLFHSNNSRNSRAATISQLCSDNPNLWRELMIAPSFHVTDAQASDRFDRDSDTFAEKQTWLSEHKDAISTAKRRAAVAVTQVAKVRKEEADGEETAYRRGRGGTSIGRAVHAVLQSVNMETGEGVAEISKAQAIAEGIPNREREIAELSRVGLDSDTVKRALASARYYREVFVAMPLGSGLMEGYIDLMFEEDGALVVVDYKTDTLFADEDIARARELYAPQVGAYALAVHEATGMPVKEVVLVFLQPEHEENFYKNDVDDLMRHAREDAEALLSQSSASAMD